METLNRDSKKKLWQDVYSRRKRADEYQDLIKLAGGKWHLDMLGAAVQSLSHLTSPPAAILELGVGTGKLASRILRHYPKTRLNCLDGSPAMLAKARQHLAPYSTRVKFIRRDFGSRDWNKGIPEVDAVISTIAIHHLTDAGKKRLYRELLTQLKPGGLFINGDPVWSNDVDLKNRDDFMWASYIQHRYKSLHGQLKPVPELLDWINTTRNAEGDKPASIEDQLRWLRDAGYVHVDCYWKNFGFAIFGGMRPKP